MTDDKLRRTERERLVNGLGRMVASGQVNEEEATRIRAAAEPAELDDAAVRIRVRHASAKLAAAVEAGSMTQAEADGYLERLKGGEHPRGLRSHLSRLVPRGR